MPWKYSHYAEDGITKYLSSILTSIEIDGLPINPATTMQCAGF
ncbi:hypothetical protein ACQBEH_11655 [Brevibacillus laterosporus]